mmetsp:Transcript_38302/g.59797  ORF Transcript_38302/g.59797 Transcript_38302/m.59797 type:complete len:92 (-) Transcript_38302:134-409(-)
MRQVAGGSSPCARSQLSPQTQIDPETARPSIWTVDPEFRRSSDLQIFRPSEHQIMRAWDAQVIIPCSFRTEISTGFRGQEHRAQEATNSGY